MLATLYDQNRVNVPLSKVAPIMRKAIIAIEDYRFYQHGALDLKGTLRAFVTNQAGSGVDPGWLLDHPADGQDDPGQPGQDQGRAQAAATADTYQRKIHELRYAIAFEQKYSKDWILERYLNIAYFGDGAYGIEAASRHYFSQAGLRSSTLREAALLAGLVKNPTGYDPTNYPEPRQGAPQHRAGPDGPAQRHLPLGGQPSAEAQPTRPQRDRGAQRLRLLGARRSSATTPSSTCSPTRTWARPSRTARRLLFSGGLTIKTTVDLRFQRAADASVRSHVNPTDQAIGGLAMVEPGTGEVRALAQSRPMGSDKKKGETYLNYVVPREVRRLQRLPGRVDVQGLRAVGGDQPGHPAVHPDQRPADGLAPGELAPRTATATYPEQRRLEPGRTPPGAGTFDLYTGTQLSVNTFFAQLEQRTGLCEPVSLARQMGVDGRPSPDVSRRSRSASPTPTR